MLSSLTLSLLHSHNYIVLNRSCKTSILFYTVKSLSAAVLMVIRPLKFDCPLQAWIKAGLQLVVQIQMTPLASLVGGTHQLWTLLHTLKPDQFLQLIHLCGIMTTLRQENGKIYKTARIGSYTWSIMSENCKCCSVRREFNHLKNIKTFLSDINSNSDMALGFCSKLCILLSPAAWNLFMEPDRMRLKLNGVQDV